MAEKLQIIYTKDEIIQINNAMQVYTNSLERSATTMHKAGRDLVAEQIRLEIKFAKEAQIKLTNQFRNQ